MKFADLPEPNKLADLFDIGYRYEAAQVGGIDSPEKREREAMYRSFDPWPRGFPARVSSALSEYKKRYKLAEAAHRSALTGADRQAEAQARQQAELVASIRSGDSIENAWRRAGHLAEYIPQSFVDRCLKLYEAQTLNAFDNLVAVVEPHAASMEAFFSNDDAPGRRRVTNTGRAIDGSGVLDALALLGLRGLVPA